MLREKELASLTASLSGGIPDWSAEESMAFAAPGRRYRVKRIFFAEVRQRCAELGFTAGDEIGCRSNRRGYVECRVPKGRLARLPREYAWFIRVEPMKSRCIAKPPKVTA
jgi:hypothetical protein